MAATPKLPSSPEELEAFLETCTDEELREIYELNDQLTARLLVAGPQNDDELHAWIKAEMGLDIPRTAVCADHDPPFNFIADLFFERVDAALLMANRGGGKTFMVAVLHWINSRFKPGCESLTFGAVEKQSQRAYSHLKSWIYDENGNRKPDVVSSLMSETYFRNRSKIEVLGSTPEQVNGPHPHKAHADEIELMRDDTWRESRNMTVAGKTTDGRVILPQDILTSTRKGPSGRMQHLIDEIDEAVAQGFKPPRAFYKYCIKETAAERPDCQRVAPEIRKARLEQLGLDPCSLCGCHEVRKGEWEDGKPRTLDAVCDGDFFRSRGWQPPQEIEKQFRENDKDTFEVQQLCLKPEMKFHYFHTFREAHHCIRHFVPDPENGPIFTSVDWGGTNPHSVHWYQLLQVEVEVDGYLMLPDGTFPPTRLKEGTIVCFDEIYKAEIGNDKLGKLVKEREAHWREVSPGFRVHERFADPQGKAAKLDWKEEGLPTSWHTTREFEEHVKVLHSLDEDDLIRIDVRCKEWIREVKGWRMHEETLKQIDEDNHAMSDFRYAIANIKKIKKKFNTKKLPPTAGPSRRYAPTVRITTRRPADAGPIGYRGRDEFAEWRRSLGAPISPRDR